MEERRVAMRLGEERREERVWFPYRKVTGITVTSRLKEKKMIEMGAKERSK